MMNRENPAEAMRTLWCDVCRCEQVFNTRASWLRCSHCLRCYACGASQNEKCRQCVAFEMTANSLKLSTLRAEFRKALEGLTK